MHWLSDAIGGAPLVPAAPNWLPELYASLASELDNYRETAGD